jgi:hypothetical protein
LRTKVAHCWSRGTTGYFPQRAVLTIVLAGEGEVLHADELELHEQLILSDVTEERPLVLVRSADP